MKPWSLSYTYFSQLRKYFNTQYSSPLYTYVSNRSWFMRLGWQYFFHPMSEGKSRILKNRNFEIRNAYIWRLFWGLGHREVKMIFLFLFYHFKPLRANKNIRASILDIKDNIDAKTWVSFMWNILEPTSVYVKDSRKPIKIWSNGIALLEKIIVVFFLRGSNPFVFHYKMPEEIGT